MANERTELLIGKENVEKLRQAAVMVLGVGGVGGMAVESLARSGVGRLILVDQDTVEASNINRQIVATTDTTGQVKVEAFRKRIHAIDPDIEVVILHAFYDRHMNEEIDRLNPDYILDCIDSLRSKEDLMAYCVSRGIPFVSCMGMARRQDPTRICLMPLDKTAGDPMAKRLRVWARKQGIRQPILTCCSLEPPAPVQAGTPLPSMMFVPAVAGLVMASQAVRDLTGQGKGES